MAGALVARGEMGIVPLLDPRRIPGAVRMSIDELDEKLAELPRDREIVLYCT